MQNHSNNIYVAESFDRISSVFHKLSTLLPRNWQSQTRWIETVCVLATFYDDAFVWNCVFKLTRKVLSNARKRETIVAFLNEIQRPVPERILKNLCYSLTRYRQVFLYPSQQTFLRSWLSSMETDDEFFWPSLLELLKELSAHKKPQHKMKIRRLILKHKNAISWKTHIESVLNDGQERPLTPHGDFKHIRWSNYNQASLNYLEKLIDRHAKELMWINNLSTSLSSKLNCVLLSMHNASLGASSGWGIPDFSKQFNENSLYQEFSGKVQKRKEFYLAMFSDTDDLEELREIWISRLVSPKLGMLLYHLTRYKELGIVPSSTLEKWQIRLRDLTDGVTFEKNYEDSLAPLVANPAVIELFMEIHTRWATRILNEWLPWHALLLALLKTGSEFVTTGKCKHLVIPWINKFFISSQRKKDTKYLTRLIKFVLNFAPETKILFVDDTTRKREPSLKLAIPELNRQLERYKIRGLGVFDTTRNIHPSDNEEQLILSALRKYKMVIIRPYRWISNYKSFYNLMGKKDLTFLENRYYDSSWKDNLDFLYWGTSVFPLTGALAFDPLFPAYVYSKSTPVPFGIFYKKQLLKLLTNETEFTPSPLFAAYGKVANLLE